MLFIIFFLKSYIVSLLLIKIKSNKFAQNISKNIAIIPFKTYSPVRKNNNIKFSSQDYIDHIHLSNIYLEIEVGENIKEINLSKEYESKINNKKQFIQLFLISNDYLFYIDDNSFQYERFVPICNYSTHLSTSYEIAQTKSTIQKDTLSIYATDYFKIFSDFSLNKYDMIKMKFRHFLAHTKNISFTCGKVGVIIPSNKLNINYQINFLKQIHDNLNVDYSFTIKFNNKNNYDEMDNGLFIIGFESYKKSNEGFDELISIYSKRGTYGNNLDWRFSMDIITIDDEYYQFDDEEFIIKSDVEGIEIPYNFYKKLNEIFFNKYYSKKICQYETARNDIYIVISCNSESFTIKDIKSFPKINFLKYILGYNFTFSGEELFYLKDNKYYFKMVGLFEKIRKEFRLGRIFLKKYRVIFNPDSKCMLFYKNYKSENSVILNKTEKNVGLIIFSYLLIGIIFLATGIFFGKKYCNIGRKIHANELEDNNYVYVSKSKGIKKNQKLIEL